MVLVNSNPATIMTDPEFAERTYIEPITPEVITKIIEKERPDALLPTLGGQTALNAAMDLWHSGVLEELEVKMIGANAEAIATLPIDISEVDSDTIVRASVPGFSAEEIDVTVEDGVLTISAKHDEPSEKSDEHYYRRERRTGSVSRRIALPRNTPDVEVAAELADGVLTLTVPTPGKQKPKQIEIKSSS